MSTITVIVSAVILGGSYFFLPDLFPIIVAVVGGSWFKHLYLDKKDKKNKDRFLTPKNGKILLL